MFCLKTSSRLFLPGSRQVFGKRLLSSLLTSDSVVLKVKAQGQPQILRLCHSLTQNNSVSHRLTSCPYLLQKVLMSTSTKEEAKSDNASCDTRAKPTTANLTTKEKLKFAVRDYGATVIVFHIGISLISLGGFYLAATSGLNVQDMVQSIGFDSPVTAATVGNAGTFVVAYAIHKVFAPVRITITLTAAPFIVRYLRGKGILKVKPKTVVAKPVDPK